MSALLHPLPETRAAVVRALVLDDLARIVSFPQVKPEPMEDVRNRAHAKQEQRRFYEQPVVPTAFGEFA